MNHKRLAILLITGFLVFFVALLLNCKKKKTNHPPDNPTISGPSSGRVDSVYTFEAFTTDPDEDCVCYRFDWNDGDTSDWSPWVDSGVYVQSSHSWSSVDVYYVKVQAKDINDFISEWSSRLIMIDSNPNRSPNPPMFYIWHRIALKDSLYTFTITGPFDPDGDSVCVRFDWGNGDTSEWSSYIQHWETIFTYIWSTFGTYYVRAQAKDINGFVSEWSDSHFVEISPLIKWRYKADLTGGFPGSPTLGSDGTIYINSPADCHLYAINSDGTLKWRYQLRRSAGGSPTIDSSGTTYVGDWDGRVYAINPDGSLKWEYWPASYAGCILYSSPTLGSDGTIYVAEGHYLFALDRDGNKKWKHPIIGYLEASSPVIGSDGTIYLGSDGLYAINPDSSRRGVYPIDGGIGNLAIDSSGTIYGISGGYLNGYLYAIDSELSLKWRYYIEGEAVFYTAPVIGSDGTIYVITSSCFYAINSDGTLKWHLATTGRFGGTPAIGNDGTIYVGGDYFYTINSSAVLTQYLPVGGGSPTIDLDGTIYFWGVEGDHCLFALYGLTPLADSPWPKYQHDLRNTGRVGGP